MSAVTVRPAEGRLVPQEDGRDWPRDAKGDLAWLTIEPTRYIRRRLRDGDLIEKTAPAPAAKPAKGD
jgi:hypothetical protein